MRVIFPIAKQAGTNLIEYPDTQNLFSNVEVIGSDIVADYSGSLVLTEYVEPTKPITNISVTTTRFKVGDIITFDFTTELPNDSYFIPYRVDGDGRKYLKDAVVLNGAGSMTFNFTSGGIYYIDRADLPLSDLQVNGSEVDRFTIYVAE